jgi:hypothetical protein
VSRRTSKHDYERVVQHLRDTITCDMVAKAYQIRFGREIDDSEYESFIDELITEHYNAGLDDWDDEFLYYD